MSEPTGAPAGEPRSGSLSPQDQQELEAVSMLMRPLKSVARVANFDGILYTVGGALSILIAFLGGIDWVGLALGVFLLVIGLVQRKAARGLRHGDRAALPMLARSEFISLCGLLSYFLFKIFGPSQVSQEVLDHASELKELGVDIEATTREFTLILYPTLIAGALIGQGLLIRYFLRKRSAMEQYLDAPEWARRTVEGIED
jgi:hypothetical protein